MKTVKLGHPWGTQDKPVKDRSERREERMNDQEKMNRDRTQSKKVGQWLLRSQWRARKTSAWPHEGNAPKHAGWPCSDSLVLTKFITRSAVRHTTVVTLRGKGNLNCCNQTGGTYAFRSATQDLDEKAVRSAVRYTSNSLHHKTWWPWLCFIFAEHTVSVTLARITVHWVFSFFWKGASGENSWFIVQRGWVAKSTTWQQKGEREGESQRREERPRFAPVASSEMTTGVHPCPLSLPVSIRTRRGQN